MLLMEVSKHWSWRIHQDTKKILLLEWGIHRKNLIIVSIFVLCCVNVGSIRFDIFFRTQITLIAWVGINVVKGARWWFRWLDQPFLPRIHLLCSASFQPVLKMKYHANHLISSDLELTLSDTEVMVHVSRNCSNGTINNQHSPSFFRSLKVTQNNT